MTVDAASRDRAVVRDDGEKLHLTVYAIDLRANPRSPEPAITTVTLKPLQAIRLARELLDGALRHLWRERR